MLPPDIVSKYTKICRNLVRTTRRKTIKSKWIQRIISFGMPGIFFSEFPFFLSKGLHDRDWGYHLGRGRGRVFKALLIHQVLNSPSWLRDL